MESGMNADVHVPNGEPEKRCWFLHPKMGSMRFYLYPVFAMQLLLISFLGTADAYRDIRSLLVGLGAVFAISAASGSTMLLLALKDDFVASRPGWPERLVCARPGSQALGRREIAQTWLAAGFAVAAAAAVALRRYAFAVYSEEGAKLHGVQLPCPLWEAVRVASGFAPLGRGMSFLKTCFFTGVTANKPRCRI
ncbi:unnamed protein product [Durusdinium trenchii]|uniref:CASP-like protein n=1 Tax=Durusdinium trenchii TaxID=1381693 RepID=A0ABP0L336_9DINO